MANTSAICSSFKQELLQGKHSFESSGGQTIQRLKKLRILLELLTQQVEQL